MMMCKKCGEQTGANWKTLCISCWKSRPIEEVRAQRQAKIDRKIARLNKWADSKEKQAEDKMSGFNELRKDWAWVTQPNINSSRGRAFSRSRQRVLDRYDDGMRLSIEAEKMREKASWLQKSGAVVKGDAERKRQEKREYADTLYKQASLVDCAMYGKGKIEKVNKKTYTVKFERGFTLNIDKSWVVL